MNEPAAPDQDTLRVRAYHQRTKHGYGRFAAGPGWLDWDSQPDPFRTWSGAPRIELPLAGDGPGRTYAELYQPHPADPAPLSLESLGAFCELALGLTAWKQHEGSRWALRANPSSGNLHPTEGYLVVPAAPGIPAGVHHYLCRDHLLEQRFEPAGEAYRGWPAGAFLVGLSSIHWREAWKYGERAFRYCQHDAGHALACVRFAAGALGWSARLLDGLGDERVARLLGLDRAEDFAAVDDLEREHPDAVALVCREQGAEADALAARFERTLVPELLEAAARGRWHGRAGALGSGHIDWTAIEHAAAATLKPATLEWERSRPRPEAPEPLDRGDPCSPRPAAEIVRQRRSAVALDRVTSIARADVYALLERLVPRPDRAPFDLLPWEPRVHLALFVHRVDDLAPGLYLFERRPGVHDELRRQLGAQALWTRPPGCPDALRLFCIGETDVRRAAASISCGQEIAADGAFSLGMLAEYEETLAAGAWNYRRLFWETGVIGQVLYLEAEARGVRGTGIGCFFDDPVHAAVGLEGERFQSLYHFTLGGPVEDARLVTRPPYEHLAPGRRAP